MCTSRPKAPEPIAAAPYVGPEVIDEQAIQERDRSRQRNRLRSGRQSTILAGNTGGQPTMPVKTALGG